MHAGGHCKHYIRHAMHSGTLAALCLSIRQSVRRLRRKHTMMLNDIT